MIIDAKDLSFIDLNKEIRANTGEITINNCVGQRFIGNGLSDRTITINGIPGNALGSYLNGSVIIVNGNAQDATGDTMNCGQIIIHGSCGDAAGYAMRGGEIYIKNDAGYRAGIHMKEYNEKNPVMIIGGKCGSFLGEYQAGGRLAVLGLNCDEKDLIGHFCGTGMHGGKILIRANKIWKTIPQQVSVSDATEADIKEFKPYIENYSKFFGVPINEIFNKHFFILTPNSKSPYKQLYVQN